MKQLLRVLALLALSSAALAGNYLGDYNVGDNVDCNFGTVRPSTGASFTLAGTPVISAYIDNSTTELTAGITLTADFDSRTGMNHVRVAATGGNGYAAGTFVSLVITTGTVDSISVVGQEVCSFTLRKGTITGIPAAVAGASGGIQIAGSNAATTYATFTVSGATTLTGNVALQDGLTVTRSTSNQPAIAATGNGTGNGVTITSGSGATGTGLAIVAASTNGTAVTAAGTGTGNGATFTSGSGATGNGLQATAASTNGNGVGLTATGTGATMTITPSNIQQFGGSAGTFASGRPEVNTTVLAGTSLATLTGAYPSLGIIDSGTAQAATGTTLQIRSAATFADNELTGASCIITGGTTGVGQSRTVSSNVGSTDTLTVPTWTTTPTGTITYVCYGTAAGSGAAPTVAQIATGIFQDTTSGDFTVAGSIGKSLFTSGATPGATGGLQIAGSNAATTYSTLTVSGATTLTGNVALQDGLTVTRSTSNQPAISATGNGTGNGATFTSGSGATGNGIQATAASTNGNGVGLTATGSGSTMTITPANTTQVGGQTASAAGTVTFPATIASATNITAATGITVATNNDKTGYTVSTVSDKTGYTLSSAGINAFADTSTTGHTTGGTWGGAWNAAGGAGDPWSTALPGSYAVGTAGNIIGNRIDAAISSRMATFTLPTNFSSLAVTGGGAVTAGTVSDKTGYGLAANAVSAATIAPDADAELAAAVVAAQGTITGVCDSGSTTTCVDDALTQSAAAQLQERLICFDDSWCGLITTFAPGSDMVTTTKIAPSTRSGKAYTIFPTTLQ